MRLRSMFGMALAIATTGVSLGAEPKAADGDAPLPDGWPAATRPGVIEIKHYPAYRSAIARAKEVTTKTDESLFFPLFLHISRKKIAMTAPVVSTYESAMLDDPRQKGEATMEFLYRTPNQGELGKGVGAVKVEDHPAATYVCLGVQGEMNPERLHAEMAKLKTWLGSHRDEWVEAGEPRRLGYHGPMTPTAQRLWEVQMPVKPTTK
jgi:hypothetical protein